MVSARYDDDEYELINNLGYRKKKTMDINSSMADALRKQAEDLLIKADAIELEKQAEPQTDDTVISWDGPSVPGSNRKGTFVAIRKGNRWWTTAVSQPNCGYNWHEMCHRWPQLRERDFHYVTKWEHA